MSRTPDMDALVKLLGQLEALMENMGDASWAETFAGLKARLWEHSDDLGKSAPVIADIRRLWIGAPGGLGDLYFSQADGHRSDQLDSANRQLEVLKEALFKAVGETLETPETDESV